MGYYANGDGWATVKKDIDILAFKELLDCKSKQDDIRWDICDRTLIFFDSEKYHEENVEDFLEAIKDFITEGQITYTGEDNSNWRFVFNAEKNEWEEESGTVDFNFASYTDAQLIKEIKRRGYTVSC